MKRAPALLLSLVTASMACGPAPRPAPPAAVATVESPPGDGRGRGASFAVDTRRAHVLRVTAEGSDSATGRLRLSSTLAGVFVRIDAAERLPLPVELELEAGPHVVVAICPDGGEETSRVLVEAEGSVDVQVCSP